MSRKYTIDEMKYMFIKQCLIISKYWARLDVKDSELRGMTLDEYRTDGVVFSILAMLDGSSVDIPGFAICPFPHEDDEEYHKQINENWYPKIKSTDDEDGSNCDFAGGLHELMGGIEREELILSPEGKLIKKEG